MAALILPSRRVVQPQGPVEVDRGNPIARGLVAALVPDGAGYIDYVNGTQYPATSASILGSGPGKVVALGGTGYTDLGVQSIGGVSLFASAASGSFTVITFAKLATAGAVGTFIAKSGASDASKTLQIFNSGSTNQTPSIVVRGSVNTTSWGFSDTAFHQYAVTFDAETATARAYGDADKSLTLTTAGVVEESQNIVIGARTGGSGARLTGQTSYTYFFNRALSQSEIAEIYRNPWQLFRPIQRRIWVSVAGGGAVSLTVSDASHAHTAENVVLTSASALTVADGLHAQAADNLTLNTTASVDLTVADAIHAQSAENVALSIDVALTVQNAAHAQTAESLVVGAAESLTVANASHAHSAENVTLTVGGIGLTVADATHAQVAESVALSSDSFLITADGSHGQVADLVTLSTATFFAVDDAAHAQTADNLSLDGAPVLGVSDSLHGQIADAVALTMESWLEVANAAHTHTAQNVTLGGGDREYDVFEGRTVTLADGRESVISSGRRATFVR